MRYKIATTSIIKGEEPPRNMNRLPEGLSGVGMGLGDNGAPLWDVRLLFF